MKNNIIVTVVMAFLAQLGAGLSCIWAIIEFVLYLAKDKVFNWWSVWSTLIFVGVIILIFIISVIKTKNALGSRSKFN